MTAREARRRGLRPVVEEDGTLVGYANLTREEAVRRDRDVLEILGARPLSQEEEAEWLRQQAEQGKELP